MTEQLHGQPVWLVSSIASTYSPTIQEGRTGKEGRRNKQKRNRHQGVVRLLMPKMIETISTCA